MVCTKKKIIYLSISLGDANTSTLSGRCGATLQVLQPAVFHREAVLPTRQIPGRLLRVVRFVNRYFFVTKEKKHLRPYYKTWSKVSLGLKWCCHCHSFSYRISIPAYGIGQQWWQLGVSKNEMSLMSFIYKMMLVLYRSGVINGSISNIYWHASKWSSISFSHWQCPSDREFSFPRFVGLLILSLCS
jgi:hypothetical protein